MNSLGDIKYSIENRVAQEHIWMAHGHGQWQGESLREWAGLGGEGVKGGKIGTTVIT